MDNVKINCDETFSFGVGLLFYVFKGFHVLFSDHLFRFSIY